MLSTESTLMLLTTLYWVKCSMNVLQRNRDVYGMCFFWLGTFARSCEKLQISIQVSLYNKEHMCMFLICVIFSLWYKYIALTHSGRNKMAANLQMTFSNAFCWMTLYESRLKYHWMNVVPKGPISNIPALVQIMAWHRPGDKPLSGPLKVRLPTHICLTPPQWVNTGLKFSKLMSIMIILNITSIYKFISWQLLMQK